MVTGILSKYEAAMKRKFTAKASAPMQWPHHQKHGLKIAAEEPTEK
jgi:hypothetical protein